LSIKSPDATSIMMRKSKEELEAFSYHKGHILHSDLNRTLNILKKAINLMVLTVK